TLPAPSSGTGTSADPLVYDDSLINTLDAPSGEYWGLLTVIDPEDSDASRPTYHTGVNPDTILPDTTRTVSARTYQVVPVEINFGLPTVVAVHPEGIVGGIDQEITFSAEVTGDPTSYDWDFDGATTPPTSAAVAPLIALPAASGVYHGTLTLLNSTGSSEPFAFSYTVGLPVPPTWQDHAIVGRPWQSFNSPTTVTSTVVNGRIAAVFQPGEPAATANIQYLRALVAVPESASDWSITTFSTKGTIPAIVNLGSEPAITFNSLTTSTTWYGAAQVADPASSGDWEFHDVGIPGTIHGITALGGRAVIISTDGNLLYARATVARPASAADWAFHDLGLVGGNASVAPVLTLAGPRLLFAYSRLGVGQYFGAKVAEPAAAADWYVEVFSNDSAGAPFVLPIPTGTGQDKVLIAYYGAGNMTLNYSIAQGQYTPVPGVYFFTERRELGPANAYVRPNVALLHNRLVLTTPQDGAGDVVLFRALTPTPAPFDWQTSVIPNGAFELDHPEIVITDNHLGVLYTEVNGSPNAQVTLRYRHADSAW
ncbi:MAG: hypothetical protein ABI743_05410, partial [bacterium]